MRKNGYIVVTEWQTDNGDNGVDISPKVFFSKVKAEEYKEEKIQEEMGMFISAAKSADDVIREGSETYIIDTPIYSFTYLQTIKVELED